MENKNFSKVRVLISDDNTTDRMILAAALNELGFQNVIQAEDGAVALAKIERAHDMGASINLLFLDWQMPKRNGLSLLTDLRRSQRHKNIKIVMTTNVADEKSVKEALNQGLDAYIIKPLSLDTLKAKLLAMEL
ncbi:response regulator [Bdellovibrio bacteriovorus]|nr:response regulator [Bdellovibrio bacteriovorus]